MPRTKPTSHNVPEWSERIGTARKKLGLSRSQLSQQLQYSPMAISRWERGIQEPPAECYIKLGKLTRDPDRWFFWERAGLNKSDIQTELPQPKSAAPAFEILPAGNSAEKDLAKKVRLVAIPLLNVHAGSHGLKGDDLVDLSHARPDEAIAAPLAWCPNPESTSCLRVTGNSMSPLIYDRDILAVDSSQTKHAQLNDKIVVVWHRKNGLSVSRFRHIDGIELLESDNRDYKSITLTSDRSWRVVGKALWLIRQIP